ncbi:BTB/POZ domain-containing protein At3g22104 isoform X2 [Malania oleifera]|uniref:BTB/POZ domain-containing protein At3g22104 isoform X2 n=1 Tax=Malania oleifera TaxID=397392 RepID=UPI0025AE5BE8|nr:BTB/POZ domain-containing protein At3g22104 isoform X2 [Malania oleifera]
MEACCDLEVDVNGEETFVVDKTIVSSFSGRLSRLFSKSTCTRNFKVIFHDFPGGPEGFERMTRFCYNNGRTVIAPSNTALLYCVAKYMEMNDSVSGARNLLEQTEKSLEDIGYWTWSELLVALKQCQGLVSVANSSLILQKMLASLVGRLAVTSEASPCPSTSSPDSPLFRFSCDSKSTESLKTSSTRPSWWFEDLLALNPSTVEMLVKAMIFRKLDHATISRFLFYYQKSKFITASLCEKRRIIEKVIDMLYSLDRSSVSCKNLFEILRVALGSKIDKRCRHRLETMIGMQMDQATLDNLLLPSSNGMAYLYDVNLVLRFLRAFLSKDIRQASPVRLKKVASLIDLYIAEVAPDPNLKPSKFLALAMALPDSARDSYNGIYHAIDMYLEDYLKKK